jgi:Transglycosylase SLT domain
MKAVCAALRRAAGGALMLTLATLCICVPVSETFASPKESQASADPDETLVFGPMKVSRWLAETIVRAAEETEVDPAYLMALADKESSLLPASKAETSSAEGLFQFLEGTWLAVINRYAAKHGFTEAAEAVQTMQGKPVVVDPAKRASILNLRRDPYLSALMAGEMVNTHKEILAGRAQRDPSFSELYMAHFLGVHGASRFLELLETKPTESAARAFPRAAKANRTLFVQAEKTPGKGKAKALTLTEVHKRFKEMIGGRVARYEMVRAAVGGGTEVASN